jgi:hypothetical protein
MSWTDKARHFVKVFEVKASILQKCPLALRRDNISYSAPLKSYIICFAKWLIRNYVLRRVIKKFPEFLGIEDLVHGEFLPPGQGATGHFYVHVLQRLRVAVRRKWRDSGRDSGFCITITHWATYRLLCSNSSPKKKYSWHNPATALSGPHSELFLAVSSLKMDPKGTHLTIMKDMKSNATAKLRKIKKEAFNAGAFNNGRIDGTSSFIRFPNLFAICRNTFRYIQQMVRWEARAGRGVLCSTPS